MSDIPFSVLMLLFVSVSTAIIIYVFWPTGPLTEYKPHRLRLFQSANPSVSAIAYCEDCGEIFDSDNMCHAKDYSYSDCKINSVLIDKPPLRLWCDRHKSESTNMYRCRCGMTKDMRDDWLLADALYP